MPELTFEWDDEKNKLNKKIHGISFKDAMFVFTERSENVIRLISARTATAAEERLYNDHNSQIKTGR